ncbi:LysR substrate-binding domain-containing protein [Chelatococcus sp. SYSU_G07232]|uniref:LysR substrate-binding domain-containing protein n=1 Tax=Chelatococcus albus TaxID=3047466 RepID=A0ABT7AH30_9HYPH|nr:LysR substrate-binding domain-containing protein [Chelatococcus sp. SYSU_G07232]MDJ1158648.1 LysR substrate-binding domain-containing protein [Chelatococcus sp. SYSU_G07232]
MPVPSAGGTGHHVAGVQHLKIRQLQLLVALGEHANLHRAAEAAHISQPAASKLLQQVEALLGTQLFERLPRGVRPTPAGEALLRHAANALAELAAAGQELAALADGRMGRVRLGSIVGAVPGLVSATALDLHAAGKRVALSITLGTSGVLIAALRDRQLDLVVGRIPVTSERDDLAFEFLLDERQAVVCRVDHPLVRGKTSDLAEALAFPWVMHPHGSVLRARFEELLRGRNLASPERAIETDSVDITVNLLLSGDFVAVLPRDTAAPWIARGFLASLPIAIALDLGAVGIVTLRERPPSPAVARVIARLRAHAARLAAAT